MPYPLMNLNAAGTLPWNCSGTSSRPLRPEASPATPQWRRSAPAAACAALTSLPELASLASDDRFRTADSRKHNDPALQEALSAVFAQGSRQGWIGSLNNAGVSAIENQAIPDYHDDPNVRKAGLIVSRDHPGMGQADHLGVVPRLSGTPAE